MVIRIQSAALVFAIILVLAGIASGSSPQSSITLERGMCFGTCPVYFVTLFENGTVFYHGEKFVKEIGNQSGTLNRSSFANLLHACNEMGFFQMNDEYVNLDMTDMPRAVITVQNGTISKHIEHYHGDTHAPANLTALENLIDEVVLITRWTGTGSKSE
jgi:hypothetical protein